MIRIIICLFFVLQIACNTNSKKENHSESNITDSLLVKPDTVVILVKVFTVEDIHIEKELAYDKYTLEDVYPYKDTTRVFQWDKIKNLLFYLDSIQLNKENWGILQNYKNRNGEAKLTASYTRDEYKRVSDTLGVQRYQSIALYLTTDSITPVLYGRDGSLIKYQSDTTNFLSFEIMGRDGEWMTESKYIKAIPDSITFTHAIFVDRNNQNIASMEKIDSIWYVRSMNPCTTGLHRPPYQQETPIGMFVLQEKKSKMFYLKDGTTGLAGYAPWANRFTNGGYIHGIPTNSPKATTVYEFSSTLGTTPRSHMCVRNATSHAKYIFDNFPTLGTIIFVLE